MISNSFNYAPRRVLARPATLDTCPIRAGEIALGPFDGARELLVALQDRLFIARTDTVDFDAPAIARVRDALGQIYLDRGPKALLDDFARDLLPLRRAASCQRCERRQDADGGAGCPGAFAPRDLRAGFAAAQREVLTLLRGLRGPRQRRGRVLDVGVGEPHSLAPLFMANAPGARTLPFDYVGLEPDPARLASLRERWPELEFLAAAAETEDLRARLAASAHPLDHLLLLRSYNHLTDLTRAFGNLLGLLRPGGTLLIVDNTAFALVRGRKKLAAIERAERRDEAPFEHHRNHTSHDALAALASFGLEPLRHQPVTPETANQWLLWLRKPARSRGAGTGP